MPPVGVQSGRKKIKGGEPMNPIISNIIIMSREIELSHFRADVYAEELVALLHTLRFEPENWTDTTEFTSHEFISTDEEGYLRIYNEYTKAYYDLNPTLTHNSIDAMHFAFMLLQHLQNGTLKIKE
jgi:hypothetical protein